MKPNLAGTWPWSRNRRAAMPPSPPPCPWHAEPLDDVLRALDVDPARGLDDDEVARRRAKFGRNVLPRAPRKGLLRIYAEQFASPLIYLLLAATVVSIAIAEYADAAFIFVVLQVNAVIGGAQEWKAETSAEGLRRLVPDRATVRRDAAKISVAAEDLVPGDVVFLESGTRVSGDIRLVSARELLVDESLLTGESQPVRKDHASVAPVDAPVAERPAMLYAGTVVLRGRAVGVVVGTGVDTEIGRIAEAIAGPDVAPPPLLVRMASFTRVIGLVITVLIVLIAAGLILKGADPVWVFVVAVALAVAAIPEGLPVAITVALAIATTRMARRNVVIRRLPAVEGLGACTLIASDKTGTLTCNELTARKLVLPGVGTVEVGGEGFAVDGEATSGGVALAGEALARARALAVSGTLCNEAVLHARPGHVTHFGDTVDVAFLVLARKLGSAEGELTQAFPQVAFIPFESQRRFAASFNRDGSRVLVHVKGAAETVIPMCRDVRADEALAAVDRLAGAGHRVLAVASGEVPAGGPFDHEALRDLRFLGLVGLIDPPRPEAFDAIARCRSAGVDVRMVTGDHPATALSIARDLGIAAGPSDVVTGAQLAALENEPMSYGAAVARARVFARVEPRQKLGIVENLQRAGHVVAVTGDGVNDAPALRAADIGVAMGRSGTDVARDCADLILTDDNFASIVDGIEEGRTAYDNVRKVVFLLIGTGMAELVLFFLSLAAGLPVPLFAVQLLWLNLVTNGIQDVALAFEKGEPGTLSRPPRPPGEPVFDRYMIEETLVSGIYMGGVAFLFFDWSLAQGWAETEARNAVLLLMVLYENAQALNARSEVRSVFAVPIAANPFLLVGIVCAQGIHILAMYTPGISGVLGIGPLAGEVWLTVVLLAVSLIGVVELYKWLRRRPRRSIPA